MRHDALAIMSKASYGCVFSALLVIIGQESYAAELILPQTRNAYYSNESVELAVSGLKPNSTATVELAPQSKSAIPVTVGVEGEGSTTIAVLPPLALAP